MVTAERGTPVSVTHRNHLPLVGPFGTHSHTSVHLHGSASLPEFDGYRPALGAWIVGDTSAGLGIRETMGLITDNGAAFVPHRIPD